MHNVHTLAAGLGRTSAGLGRTRHVFGSSLYFRGLECSSSPTSGTADPLLRGVFALTRVQPVYKVSPDAGPGLCGVAVACLVVWVAGQVSWLQALRLLGVGLWASPFRLALVDGFGLIPLHGAAQFRRHDFGDFFQDFLTSFARAAGLEWPLLVLLG